MYLTYWHLGIFQCTAVCSLLWIKFILIGGRLNWPVQACMSKPCAPFITEKCKYFYTWRHNSFDCDLNQITQITQLFFSEAPVSLVACRKSSKLWSNEFHTDTTLINPETACVIFVWMQNGTLLSLSFLFPCRFLLSHWFISLLSRQTDHLWQVSQISSSA